MDVYSYVAYIALSCSANTANSRIETKQFDSYAKAKAWSTQMVKTKCFTDPIEGKCCRVSQGIEFNAQVSDEDMKGVEDTPALPELKRKGK